MDPITPSWRISQESIFTEFAFLQSEYGFPKFESSNIKDELNISSRCGMIEFSATIWTYDFNPPSLAIINHDKPTTIKLETLDDSGKLELMSNGGRKMIVPYIQQCAILLYKNNNLLTS